MEKTKSKKKTASKIKQPKKISRKHTHRNATSLCFCVGHQVSSDSSSENLAGEGVAQNPTGCNEIQLSKSALDEGGITQSQNTTSDPLPQDNRHPTKTKSSELIHLFYTIVADDDFTSEPSDSDGSVSSDVQHEVQVDVHHYASSKSIVGINKPRSHSGINSNNAIGDDSEKEPWFAIEEDYFSSMVDLQIEGVSDLAEVAEEREYCGQNAPKGDETDSRLSLDCTDNTQQISSEKEYMDFIIGEEHDVFPNQSYLNVIEEVSEEDCDSNSNTSVETVRDVSPPMQSTVGVQDVPQDVPPTKPDTTLENSKEHPDLVPSSGEGSKLCNVILSNTVDQISISDERARPQQRLDIPTTRTQETNIVFSQDQAYTEIIASGSRMVDQVKEILSELLDVCMHSRAIDASSVAAHGDFREAISEISSPGSLTDIAETQNGNQGIQQTPFIDGSDEARSDMDKVRSTDEIHVDPPADQECGNNGSSISLGTPSDESDVPVDQFRNNELPVSSEISSNEADLAGDECRYNKQTLSVESSSREIGVPFDEICGNNEKPLFLETLIVPEKIIGSSNNECPAVGSLGYEPQHETQPENSNNDTKHDITKGDGDQTSIDVGMGQNQRMSDIVENDETPFFIPENTKIETDGLLHRTDEVWPVKKIEGYDLPDVTSVQETSYDKFDQESPRIVKIIGVDIERDIKTEEEFSKSLTPEQNVEGDAKTSFENQIVKIIGVDTERDSETENTLFENLASDLASDMSEEDIRGDVQTPYENQIVKIVGVDIDQELKTESAPFKNTLEQNGGDIQTPFETQIVKIVGVDTEQESSTEEALLEKLASEDSERDVQIPFENQIVKIIGVDIKQDPKAGEAALDNPPPRPDVGRDVQIPFENHIVKLVGVDIEEESKTGETSLKNREEHCGQKPNANQIVKIVGVDADNSLDAMYIHDINVETHFPASVDEEGDSAPIEDRSLDVTNEEIRALEWPELHAMGDQSQDIANRSQDVTGGDGDIGDGMIRMESGGSEIINSEPVVSDKAPGHNDATEDASDMSEEVTDHDKTQNDVDIQINDLNQENDILTGCNSPPSQGSNATAVSPSLSCSSFETLRQGVLEDDFVMVPYSPTIIVPPPQEEYNGDLMSPEFEADDIIVNFATVSAMGDVAPAQRRSGVPPLSPPDPIQFEDVNSRSPSPLPQTDLTLLDCLFDICEESLQRFPYKMMRPGRETYISKKSEPSELSPGCLGEQGDSIPCGDSHSSSAVTKDPFGSVGEDDQGFFYCDPVSSDSYCSLLSMEHEPDRPLITQNSSERYFSFDTFSDSIEDEKELLRPESENTPNRITEPGSQQILDQYVFLHKLIRRNQESQVTQMTKAPNSKKHSQDTADTLDLFTGDTSRKEGDTDLNLVFFLALFTFILFIYCKYGTRVLQTIKHWLWICQLIIQLFIDS